MIKKARPKKQKRISAAQRAALDKHRKPWKKGESGNPAGKPKWTPNRSTSLKRYAEATFKTSDGKSKAQPFGLNGEPITVEEAIALALINQALKGKVDAIREYYDTVYGKIKDTHEFSGIGGGPIQTAAAQVTHAADTPEELAAAYAALLRDS